MSENTKEEIALILQKNTAWCPQAGCYIIHGAIEKIQEKIDQEKRSTAIAFTNWQAGPQCEYSMTDEDQWTRGPQENITTEQLYDIYKDFLYSIALSR